MEIWFLMTLTYVLTFLVLIWLIEFQKKKHIGQHVREEGLESHKKKNNTPIFGGVAFVSVYIIVFTLLLVLNEVDIFLYLLVVFPLISYATLGFVDDFLILKFKNNRGIKPNLKFFVQIIIAIIYFVIYLSFNFDTTIDLIIFKVNLKFLYGIFILLSFSGFSNALNITDGADGLLAGTFSFIIVGLYFIIDDIYIRNYLAIIFAGLCAFLYFNLPKAKIFMGDTGSLALGSLFVSIFIILKMEIFMFVFGLVYLIEVGSVMLQVMYFKKTKGKRIFKMAPIHHHFEITLKSETKTLILFYMITIISVILGMVLYINA